MNANKHLKTRFAAYKAKGDWKKARRYDKPAILKKSSLCTTGKGIFADRQDDLPMTWLEKSDIANRLDHNGWYTDNFQDGTLIPCVAAYRNPKKLNEDGGHLFYMPARRHSDWDGVTVYPYHCDSAIGALYAADEYCRVEAENSREDDAKFQAEIQGEDLAAEIHALNKRALPLIRELKGLKTPLPAPICGAVRESLAGILADRKAAFERIEELADNYWLAVEGY